MKPEEVVLEELDKVMNKFIDRVFELSQLNLVNDGKIDTGTLLKTANINRRFLEKEIVYPSRVIGAATEVLFGSTVWYPKEPTLNKLYETRNELLKREPSEQKERLLSKINSMIEKKEWAKTEL